MCIDTLVPFCVMGDSNEFPFVQKGYRYIDILSIPFKLSRPLDDTSFFELFLYSILIPFSTISESLNLIFSFFTYLSLF